VLRFRYHKEQIFFLKKDESPLKKIQTFLNNETAEFNNNWNKKAFNILPDTY
jgi:hypothetical protein